MRVFYLLILVSFLAEPVFADNPVENEVLNTTTCTTDTTWLPVAHFCWGQAITLFGQNYLGWTGTAYSPVYSNVLGCDSIAAQSYVKHSSLNEVIEICEGDSVLIDSVYWTTNQMFNYPGMVKLKVTSENETSPHISFSGFFSDIAFGSRVRGGFMER